MSINKTLEQRGERYGKFKDVAATTQQLMSIVERGANYGHLNAEQKTSLFIHWSVKPRGLARGYKRAI